MYVRYDFEAPELCEGDEEDEARWLGILESGVPVLRVDTALGF